MFIAHREEERESVFKGSCASVKSDKKRFLVEKKEECSTKSEEISVLGKKSERSEKSIPRRSKHDLKGRDYLCSMCWKTYLSYAAIYVHLKKKHNITIDGLKTGYIKRNKVSPIELMTKVRQKPSYKNFYSNFEEFFEKVYNETLLNNYSDYSEFLNTSKYGSYKCHPFYKTIWRLFYLFKDKPTLNKKSSTDIIKNLDDALSLFVFGYWSYNSHENNEMNLRVALLFREFCNFIGWDHLKLLANYRIVDKRLSKPTEEYTNVMLAENLPELIEDFLNVYIKRDAPKFSNNLSEIKNFISEFCHFLFKENLTNYMVEPLP